MQPWQPVHSAWPCAILDCQMHREASSATSPPMPWMSEQLRVAHWQDLGLLLQRPSPALAEMEAVWRWPPRHRARLQRGMMWR
jgi:hypothetical protein